MDFSNYKFRCHYQGNLVSTLKPLTETNSVKLSQYRDRKAGIGKPLTENQENELIELEYKNLKSKKYELSITAKNTCAEIVFAERFKRRFSLENKFFEKGVLVEKESRDILTDVLGIRLVADKHRKSNEWVIGERDIKSTDVIIDLKSTWDFNTFSSHLLDSKEEFYFRQLDSYMDLWDIQDSLLAFVLVDTPIHILNQEITRQNYRKFFLDDSGEVADSRIEDVKKIVSDHLYSREALESFCQQSGTIRIEWFDDFQEITIKDRVHLIPHKFDKARIEQRNESLTLCRKFMSDLKPMNNIEHKLIY
jgi:hypothetical protein